MYIYQSNLEKLCQKGIADVRLSRKVHLSIYNIEE